MKLSEKIILVLKGFAMGTSDIIPGVSGGTIALISGIYDEFINSLAQFRLKQIKAILFFIIFYFINEEKKELAKEELKDINWSFLIFLFIGIGSGILIMSRIIPSLMMNYPFQIFSFFFGLILFSIYIPFKLMNKRFFEILLLIIFFTTTFYLMGLSSSSTGSIHPAYIFLSGSLAICAMVLPGISGAYILLILGEYKIILDALHDRDLKIIAIFMSGIIMGIFFFIKLIQFLLQKYHSLTMAALTGLMAGSLRKIIPIKTNIFNYLTDVFFSSQNFSSVKILQLTAYKKNSYVWSTFNSQLFLEGILFALIGSISIFLLYYISKRIEKKSL